MTTANGMYSYDTLFYSKKLSEWVDISHRYMTRAEGWQYRPLHPETYGYDNHAMSIATMLTEGTQPEIKNIEKLSSAVHDGWTLNYCWWRDNKPQRAHKPLGDDERNKLAATPYSELPEREKEKDRMVVRAILFELDNKTEISNKYQALYLPIV
jgi:hypothetical protein